MCRKSRLVLLGSQLWYLLRMVLQSSKPFSLKWWHRLLLYFSEVVLLWMGSRQCPWAKSLFLGKNSDGTVGLQEGIKPMCGFCLLFAWANSYQNLKMYEYALQEGIWQFTDWSTGWGTHRGPRDAAGASLCSCHPLHQSELMHILRLYSLIRENLLGVC